MNKDIQKREAMKKEMSKWFREGKIVSWINPPLDIYSNEYYEVKSLDKLDEL
jgi:hypothetical protein